MIVRKMRTEEFDSTMILVGYYADEASEHVPNFAEQYDENSALETVRMFASQYQYCWLNAYDNTRPVGFIAGYLVQCPWNKKLMSTHIAFVYLLESHRNIENFKMLLDAFEEWSKLSKATEITAGDIGINPERTQKLYEFFGFKPDLTMSKGLNYE